MRKTNFLSCHLFPSVFVYRVIGRVSLHEELRNNKDIFYCLGVSIDQVRTAGVECALECWQNRVCQQQAAVWNVPEQKRKDWILAFMSSEAHTGGALARSNAHLELSRFFAPGPTKRDSVAMQCVNCRMSVSREIEHHDSPSAVNSLTQHAVHIDTLA
jgi:hypothetical protein